uniref:uncharacterized protein LOC120346553 n=1 Tax=Styela clava TaxID=7725 RepID=UPI00193A9B03|nr:uncharacterized protein LOC120346553 [Styela clava]
MHDRSPQNSFKNFKKKNMRKCGWCGNIKHAKEQCPAKSSECHKCHKIGHWAKVCRSTGTTFKKQRNAAMLRSSKQEIHPDYYASSLNSIQRTFAATKDLKIGKEHIKFLIDTGSDVNTLPAWMYKKATGDYRLRHVKKARESFMCYNGQSVHTIGNVNYNCSDDSGKTHNLNFLLLNDQVDPLIGIQSAIKTQLVTLHRVENPACMSMESKQEQKLKSKQHVLSAYPQVFADIPGDIGVTHHICIDSNVQPVYHKQRKVQEPLRVKVKEKLDMMEKQGIIKPVSEPTDWQSSMITVLKPNKEIRICLDCKELNDAIKREYYTMLTFEEIASRLNGARYFTKLDAKHGYHQIRLDGESSFLTIFSTPFQRYRFLRIPFGLNKVICIFAI